MSDRSRSCVICERSVSSGACACVRVELRAGGDHIEADRLEQRVGADVGLLREIGWCPGAEHYSRHLAGRDPGAPPVTLLDYLGFDSSASSSNDQKSIQSGSREWLLVADESHVMLPQLRAMHGGDRSRKLGLVRGGYRLPSALDNRPLNFDEFWARVPKALLVSATPGETEAAWCASGLFDVAGGGGPEGLVKNVPSASASEAAKKEKEGVGMVDMVVRPSGVLDPEVTILPRKEQLPALAAAVRRRAARGEASLVCALTKTDCEDLAGYLCAIGGVRADWLHSGLTAKERAVKLQRLQQGELDCLVGAQLLREGLDVPQVSLVIVLDAGVPGFARSSRSLMQMMGRAARNKRGEAILFADEPHTPAMNEAVAEVARRREKQKKHNERFGVTPRTASRGSASASLSLFEVMASEIAETREAIDAVSLGDRGRASRAVRTEDDEEALGVSADADGDAVFAPSEEEVERAMRAWRLRRAGADADAAAAASAAAEARARKEAVAQEVGPVWNALARDFTERQFTEALFSATPGDAPELEAGRGEGSSAEGRRVFDEDKEDVETLDTLLGAEAVLRAFGGDHAHVASLRALVRDLPAKTGVYRWLDASGQVLYVGKAKNLRSRTGGYLAPSLLRASPRHRSLLSRARGVDAVLHTASLVDYGHASETTLESINVGGVENVIRACREAGVPALVHTSTMDVIYAGRPVVDDPLLCAALRNQWIWPVTDWAVRRATSRPSAIIARRNSSQSSCSPATARYTATSSFTVASPRSAATALSSAVASMDAYDQVAGSVM